MTDPGRRRRGALFDALEGQRRFVYLAVILLSLGGIGAALRLPSAIYPELQFSRVTIVVQGSSLGARQQLFSITRPIEEAISIVPGVLRVTSRSVRGGSEINVNFTPTTEMVDALQQVRARVNQVQPDLPDGLDIQVERMTPSLFPILSYNLEGGDPATLYDIARYQIKPIISRVPGVGRVDVMGSDVREIEVVADPARLASLGMTYEGLADTIRQATAVSAVGRMPQNYKQYLIVTATEAHAPEDIGAIVIGRGLRVRDIATVIPGTEDHVRIVAGNGKPVASISVTRQLGGSSLAIADSIAGVARTLAPTLPPGVRLTPVYDQALLVRDAVRSVRDAMLIGAALAVIVLLLFLRHGRITAISAASIPLTLIITIFLMSLLGQTFNLMTLGAMAIAIGLVIDDAVVITENIVRHLHLTPERHRAIRDAVQELIWPVTTSTLTTVVVFLPLGLLQGVVGQFFKALSITLTVAVLVSLLLALTIIPLLADRYLTAEDAEQETGAGAKRGMLAGLGRAVDALADRYGRALDQVLHHARVAVIASVGLVLGGYLVYRTVETGFLPEMDEGAFVFDYFTPGGTALSETDRMLHEVETIMARTPEVAATSRRTGAELGLFATEQNSGDIVVRLKPESQRSRSIFEVMDTIRTQVEEQVPRMRIEFVQILSDVINDLAGASRPVEIKLFGPDLQSLEEYAGKLEPDMDHIDGLEDFYNGISEPAAEMAMAINQSEANRAGLTPEAVARTVSGALLGAPAGEMRLDDRAVGVRVRAPDSVRFDPQRLASLPVFSPDTRVTVPLGRPRFVHSDGNPRRAAAGEPAADDHDDSRRERPRAGNRDERGAGSALEASSSGGNPGGAGGPVCGAAGGLPRVAARARARRRECGGGHGDPVPILRGAARGIACGAPVFPGCPGSSPADRYRPERGVVHGPDPAGGAGGEKWNHSARLYPAQDARQRIGPRGRAAGSRANPSPPDPDDHPLHSVRAAAARARPWRRQRTSTPTGAGGDRRAGPLDACHPVRRTDPAGRDPWPALQTEGGSMIRIARTARLAAALLLGLVANSFAQGTSYKVIKTLPVGGDGGWDYVTVDTRHNRLIVPRSTHVMVIDLATGQVMGDIPNTPGVHGVAIADDLGKGFTSNGRDTSVTIFDLETLAVQQVVKVTGLNPDAITYDPYTHRVFSMNHSGGSVTAIDAASGKVVGTATIGGVLEAGVSDLAGTLYVNVEDSSQIVAVDARTMAVKRKWNLEGCTAPTGIAMDRAHHRVFSACGESHSVAVLDTQAGKLVTTVPICSGTDAAFFDPAQQLLFTSCGDGKITVIHEDTPDKYTVVGDITTEPRARTMALDEKTHRLYTVTAQFNPPPENPPAGQRPRATMIPGSFHVLVIDK